MTLGFRAIGGSFRPIGEAAGGGGGGFTPFAETILDANANSANVALDGAAYKRWLIEGFIVRTDAADTVDVVEIEFHDSVNAGATAWVSTAQRVKLTGGALTPSTPGAVRLFSDTGEPYPCAHFFLTCDLWIPTAGRAHYQMRVVGHDAVANTARVDYIGGTLAQGGAGELGAFFVQSASRTNVCAGSYLRSYYLKGME